MEISHALRLTTGDVVALTGGGGKTTTMFRLADEIANQPSKKMRVLTTTSTRLSVEQVRYTPAHVIFNPARESLADILPRLNAVLAKYNQVLLTGSIVPEQNKAMGVSTEVIDVLADGEHVDVVIVEADGAREQPFKAPAAHEPVIPDRTTIVVPVVGLEVVEQPLSDEHVHRAALVSQLSGTDLGEPVTVDTITAVLSHPQGGLKRVPAPARVVPLLNKAENPANVATARELAARLLTCDRIDSVTIGAVQAKDPVLEVCSRPAAIILAAGGSTRFGSTKQLACWGQKTFIENVVDVAMASGVQPVVVVLGAEAERCRAALGNRAIKIVVNEAWRGGQSTSMKAGLAALPANAGSVVFLLVDLPGVTPDVLEALIQRHRQTLAPIVWPEFEGQRGNPVLFDRRLFPELKQISGDTGGRPLVLAYQNQAERVTVTNKAILQDVDRPEDLERIT